MDRPVGLLRTAGEKIGEKMVLRNFYFNFRCVLVEQDELQIERFTIAPALNTENIEAEKVQASEENVDGAETEQQ